MGLSSKMIRHANLVERVADALGVDLVDAAQRGEVCDDTLSSMVVNCVGCTDPAACEEWLDAHPDGAPETPSYCRNKAMLDRLGGS